MQHGTGKDLAAETEAGGVSCCYLPAVKYRSRCRTRRRSRPRGTGPCSGKRRHRRFVLPPASLQNLVELIVERRHVVVIFLGVRRVRRSRLKPYQDIPSKLGILVPVSRCPERAVQRPPFIGPVADQLRSILPPSRSRLLSMKIVEPLPAVREIPAGSITMLLPPHRISATRPSFRMTRCGLPLSSSCV